MSKNNPPQNLISININGKDYFGYYTIDKKIITVHYGLSNISTQIGNSITESLARIILSEMINQN